MSHQRKSKIVTPKDEWGTPQWLFDLLDQEFHFGCDAAATWKNSKCNHLFSEGQSNALFREWFSDKITAQWNNVFWLNPPYSAGNIDRFMAKAYEESLKGAVVVCLVPAATDTKWWHNYAMKAQEIRFIKGRVNFVGYDEQGNQIRQSPTFSSCVVIFNLNRARVDSLNERLPTLPAMPRIGPTIEQPKKEKPPAAGPDTNRSE